MYFRSQLTNMLIDDFTCDPELVGPVVDSFLSELGKPNSQHASVILSDDDVEGPIVEGDLEEDAEYVYNHQVYWEQPDESHEVKVSAIEVVELPSTMDRHDLAPMYESINRDGELPYQDKLSEVDGER